MNRAQNLARFPIHQQLPIKPSPLLQQQAPEKNQDGISMKELQRSIENHFTQPTEAAILADEKTQAVTKKEPGVGSGVSFLKFLLGAVRLFKVYMQHCGICFVTALVVLLACSLRGDLALMAVLTYKSYYGSFHPTSTPSSVVTNDNVTNTSSFLQHDEQAILPDYLQLPESYNLKDLLFYLVVAVTSSELMYHVICGFLQVYYYKMQRDQPEKWKCQPHRFLTRSNEAHEMVVGTINLVIAGGISGFLSCWIINGNYSTVYFRADECGYPYLLFSIVGLFVWLEGSAYYSHALLHTPWLYKNVHKHHHRYHSPTAYSVIAMSPFELLFYDTLFIIPLFLFPINGFVYVAELVYVYYFGLMDHSGIKMESWLPWQPDTMFHDNHHRYFHCNFGFNAYWFDKLHGTLQRKDRTYGEHIFGGKGKQQ